MTIGDIIKAKRKEMHMTQDDLAVRVGVTKPTVSRWESGDIRNIKRNMIVKLSKELQLDPLLFVRREEILMPDESKIIDAYRRADDGTKAAIRKLLDIPE